MSASLVVELGPLAGDWARLGAADPLASGFRALLARRGGEPVARLAFGFAEALAGAPGRTGMIGYYEAREEEGGVALLRRAVALLEEGDPARIVGPIDGSTWARYRLALPRAAGDDPGPPFLAEPTNPPEYPAHFAAAGLGPFLDYESRLVSDPGAVEGPTTPAARLRPLDLARLDRELRSLYELSLEAFAGNLLYSPIPFERFASAYEAMLPLLDPSLVLLAPGEGGGLLGYVFAFPDALAPPGRPRVVLKTLAVAPGARGLGLGGELTAAVHRAAARRGASVVHALMLSSNVSTRISARHRATLFRRYRLFGREGP